MTSNNPFNSNNPFVDQLKVVSTMIDDIKQLQSKYLALVQYTEPAFLLNSFVYDVIEKGFESLTDQLYRSGIRFTIRRKTHTYPYGDGEELELEFAISDKGWLIFNYEENQLKPIFYDFDGYSIAPEDLIKVLFKDKSDKIERWLLSIGEHNHPVLEMYLKVKNGLQPYLNHLEKPNTHASEPELEIQKKIKDGHIWTFPFSNMDVNNPTDYVPNGYKYQIFGFKIDQNGNLWVNCKSDTRKYEEPIERPVDFRDIKTWVLLTPYLTFIKKMINEAIGIRRKWLGTNPATVVLTELKKRLLSVLILIGMDNEK